MESPLQHLSPFSKIEVIILANRPAFSRVAFGDSQLFGMLTIANKPILAHLLDQFDRFNFGKIKVVCLMKDQSSYADFLFSYSSRNIQLVPVDGAQTTCEIMRKVANPNCHIFVFPIDLLTSINLTEVVDFHLTNQSHITVIATRQCLDEKERKNAPGMINLSSEGGKRFFVFEENKPSTLVTLLSDATALNEDLDLSLKNVAEDTDIFQENSQNAMSVYPNHLKGFHSLVVDSSLMLTNAYIISPKGIAYLRKNNIHSIESELIPKICLESKNGKSINASIFVVGNDDIAFRVTDYASLYIANMRCSARKLSGFSPAASFVEAESENVGYYREEPLKVPDSFKYSNFSVYGSYLSCQSDDIQIQRSVIGRHCKIGKGAKIYSSILFDHVSIDDGVILRDCLVGSDVVIKCNSRLAQCIVAPRFTSEKGFSRERCVVQIGEK